MIRVASYCRVSTDQDDQANSFAAQQRYFREYIGRHPDWELYAVYADEGISGTSTKKRTQFNRMIHDAREGKFSLILTKEVSRFSRNILDTISYTRELKAMGVGVQFVIDGIHTLDPDAELRLSIMASLAQEESRKTSARVVWGQTRQMERGIVFGRSLLGYDVKDGRLTINAEGAALVRLIFHKYALEQVSAAQIAQFLTEEGYRTCTGSAQWRSSTVVKILKNEKYVGDLVQRKTYTPDYLTHEKKPNTGQVPKIIIRNHHAPIISREVWALAQERLRRNNRHQKEHSSRSGCHVFSGRIRCGECGSLFVCRYKRLKDGTRVRRWCCGRAQKEGAAACGIGKLVRDDDAMGMLKTAIRSLTLDREAVIAQVMALAAAGEEGAKDHLEREAARIRRKKESLLDSFLEGTISKSDMQAMNRRYDHQLGTLHERLARAAEPLLSAEVIPKELEALLNCDTESEILYKTLLEQLTVFRDRHLELRLKHLSQVFRFE